MLEGTLSDTIVLVICLNLPVKIVLCKCAGKTERNRWKNMMWSSSAAEFRCSVIVIREFSLSIVLPEYTTFIYEMRGSSLSVKAVVLKLGSLERKDKAWSNVISSERMNRALPACKSRGSSLREPQLSAMALFVQWQATIKLKWRNIGRRRRKKAFQRRKKLLQGKKKKKY